MPYLLCVVGFIHICEIFKPFLTRKFTLMQAMHEIAVNVIVHYKASASVVFLCLFIMVLILYVEFLYFIC